MPWASSETVRRACQDKGKQLGPSTREGTEMAGTIDEARLGEFMGQMAGYMTGGALCLGYGWATSWASTAR